MRISIIEPHIKNFDRMSKLFIMPRYGSIAIATALKNAGYEVRVFSEFIRSSIDWDYVYSSDYICFALMSFCAQRGYQLAQQVRQNAKVPIIFGGAHPTVLPEECLDYCDYVIRNEGEVTLLELLDTLQSDKDVSSIKGLSFRNNQGEIVHNPKREFVQNIDVPQDIALLHDYEKLKDSFQGKNPMIHMQVIQTSRGCPFNCKFCVAPEELGTRYRTKSMDTVLYDIENGIGVTGSKTFLIVDNEFTVKRERTKELLKSIIATYRDSLYLMVFARIEIGQEPELLQLMKEAGVRILFIGIESVNESSLKYYQKKISLDTIRKNIARVHSMGINTMGSTILGSDYDTPDLINNTADFFIENEFTHATFYSLYEIPTKEKVLGIKQMFPDNRFIHRDWRFFNSAYVIHYPKFMKPSTLQKIIIKNYKKFYSLKRRSEDHLKGTAYSRMSIKLFSVNPEIAVAEKYIPFLEQFEDGLYDENEHLLEEKLPRDATQHVYIHDIPIDMSDI